MVQHELGSRGADAESRRILPSGSMVFAPNCTNQKRTKEHCDHKVTGTFCVMRTVSVVKAEAPEIEVQPSLIPCAVCRVPGLPVFNWMNNLVACKGA